MIYSYLKFLTQFASAGSREMAAKAATMTSTESANKLSLLFYLSDNNAGTFPTEIDLLFKLQVLL